DPRLRADDLHRAGHRRLRPLGHPRQPAPALRGGPFPHRPRGDRGAGEGRQDDAQGRVARDQALQDRHRPAQPAARLRADSVGDGGRGDEHVAQELGGLLHRVLEHPQVLLGQQAFPDRAHAQQARVDQQRTQGHGPWTATCCGGCCARLFRAEQASGARRVWLVNSRQATSNPGQGMSAATQELDQFVRAALASGASKDEVAGTLESAGWDRDQVQNALDAWADVPFAVPVPRPRPYLSARDAFLYLLMFSTLYLTAWHVGSLLFDLINLAFPAPAYAVFARAMRASSMRWSIAGLVIAFPVFVLVARVLGRELERSPVRRLSAVRRWLTYLTLFLAATVLICDMIVLVYNLL